MSATTNPCETCRELLSAHSDGEIPALDSSAAAHLASCPACREFQHDLVTVRSALHTWADEAPRDRGRFVASEATRPTRVMRRLAAAAVLVCAIAAGFAAGRATAPGASPSGGATTAAPADLPPVERERFVVPERNEVHSTISLAAVEERERRRSDRSHR